MRYLALTFVIILCACTSQPTEAPEPEPLPPTAVKQEPAPTPSPTMVTEKEEESQFASHPERDLDPNGPWLVFYDSFSLKMLVVNQDGSGRKELSLPQPLPPSAEILGATSQGLFAYISGDDGHEKPDLEIIVVQLPSGEIFDRIQLIDPEWHEKALPTGVEDPDLYLADVIQSIIEPGSIQWSPQGRYLAYVGATHGPSGDIYVYDPKTKNATRITTGAGQAAALSWSPGSEWIAHLAIDTFCCGAGWNVDALWVVDPTGTDAVRLTEGGGMFFVQKWLGDQSLIVTRWTASFGLENLWAVDITKTEDMIRFFEAPLVSHAFDTAGSVVAVHLETYGAQTYGVSPGIYLQPRYGGDPVEIRAGVEPLTLDYTEAADRFVVGLANEVITFDRSGEIDERIPAGGSAVVSPNGNLVAIFDNGEISQPGLQLYSFATSTLQSFTDLPIRDLFWGHDSKGLFLTLESRELVYVPVDSVELFLVDQVDSPFGGSMCWVEQ